MFSEVNTNFTANKLYSEVISGEFWTNSKESCSSDHFTYMVFISLKDHNNIDCHLIC